MLASPLKLDEFIDWEKSIIPLLSIFADTIVLVLFSIKTIGKRNSNLSCNC